jgi:HSP20 family protein
MSLMLRNPYDPFYEVDQLLNRMHSVMDTALIPFDRDFVHDHNANPLALDMTSDEHHVIIRTALPGFKEDEINVSVQGNVLTISAESKTEHEDKQASWHIREMRYGKFARSVMLPEEVITDKADASLENGILTVKLPKQKANPIQQIAVKARNLLRGNGKKSS